MLCKCPWEALMTVKGKERGKLQHQHLPWLQCQVHPPWIHPETVTCLQKHLPGGCCISSTLQPSWAVRALGSTTRGPVLWAACRETPAPTLWEEAKEAEHSPVQLQAP